MTVTEPDVLAGVWGRITPLTIAKGEGAWVETVDGDRYLDFTAGIAVCSTGHCHPQVVEAIRAQAGRILHAQVNCYRHEPLIALARRLVDLTPGSIEKFFFSNSGAEAVEAAVKLAKQATGRTNIVVFQGSFHGRTHLTSAMTTSKSTYRLHSQPLPSGVFVAPFPDLVRAANPETEIDRCVDELRLLLASQSDPTDTAAIILEPVQGEGGYRPVPSRFMSGVHDICREHGILFVADEIQTGFGRTGTMFAIEQYDVEPDIILLAKGIASGMPLSAVGARASLMDGWVPGSHGGTYGGNAVSCAAALATIDVIVGQDLIANAQARGRQLREALTTIAHRHPGVADIRGLGLMLAIEFDTPAVAAAVVRECFEQRLILTTAGHTGTVIRWMPPLVVTADEMAHGIDVFTRAVAAVVPAT